MIVPVKYYHLPVSPPAGTPGARPVYAVADGVVYVTLPFGKTRPPQFTASVLYQAEAALQASGFKELSLGIAELPHTGGELAAADLPPAVWQHIQEKP